MPYGLSTLTLPANVDTLAHDWYAHICAHAPDVPLEQRLQLEDYCTGYYECDNPCVRMMSTIMESAPMKLKKTLNDVLGRDYRTVAEALLMLWCQAQESPGKQPLYS